MSCEFGAKRVDDIVAGDRVWSRDEHDAGGPVEFKAVGGLQALRDAAAGVGLRHGH